VLTKKPNAVNLINFPHPHDYMKEKGFDAQDRASTLWDGVFYRTESSRIPKTHYSSAPLFQ